ncbi:MBL fold metallo-hydrolase [Salinicola halophyticus]|uniref:MBL fold metallo-hydrolase n=1 Tax=Salinicola halophyticus TaxID=1808881 RepID=UPI003F462E0A
MTESVEVGKFKITWLLDGTYPCTPDFIPGARSEEGRHLYQKAGLPPEGPSIEPFHAFAIEWQDHLWLIDTGCGQEAGPERGKVPEQLRSIGYAPEDVEGIIITHLHKDHTGGLLTPEGRARYRNAQLYVGESEMAFWTGSHVPEGNMGDHKVTKAVLEQYEGRIKVVPDNAVIVPGLKFVPLYGHSPGHTGVMIEDRGQQMLMWADLMHSSVLQFHYPHWSVFPDMDPERAVATRLQLLEQLVEEDTMVAGSHTYGTGRVRRGEIAYELVPMEADDRH